MAKSSVCTLTNIEKKLESTSSCRIYTAYELELMSVHYLFIDAHWK